MNTPSAKSAFSAPRQALVDLMSELRFGRIDALVIRDGEPIVAAPTVVLQSAKFGSGEEPPPRPRAAGHGSHPRHISELFAFFDGLQNASAVEIVVQEGLPIRAVANVTGTIGRGRATDQVKVVGA